MLSRNWCVCVDHRELTDEMPCKILAVRFVFKLDRMFALSQQLAFTPAICGHQTLSRSSKLKTSHGCGGELNPKYLFNEDREPAFRTWREEGTRTDAGRRREFLNSGSNQINGTGCTVPCRGSQAKPPTASLPISKRLRADINFLN